MNYNHYGSFEGNSQYYENSMPSYGSNPPMFTEQELYAFEPAQQNIYQQTGDVRIGEEEVAMGYMGQEYMQPKGQQAFGGFSSYPTYSSVPRPSISLTPDGMMEGQYIGGGSGSDFYSPSKSSFASSCESSPFTQLPQLRTQQQQTSFMQPVSPITPSGSPHHLESGYNMFNTNPNPAPPAFLLVPTMVTDSTGQYQQCSYSAYQVPMMPMGMSGGGASVPSSHSPLPEHPSPYTVCSSAVASPSMEPPALDDDDASVLPNSGNTELRGMGLYDEPPELVYADPGSPGGYSPITPHDQLRPTLGKGLVLEKSFGLPDTMMMKDERSGKIIEGHLEVDSEDEEEEDEEEEDDEDDEESEYGDEPMIADHDMVPYGHNNFVQQSAASFDGAYSNYPVQW